MDIAAALEAAPGLTELVVDDECGSAADGRALLANAGGPFSAVRLSELVLLGDDEHNEPLGAEVWLDMVRVVRDASGAAHRQWLQGLDFDGLSDCLNNAERGGLLCEPLWPTPSSPAASGLCL